MDKSQITEVSTGPGRDLREIRGLLNSFKNEINWTQAQPRLYQALELMLCFVERTWHETERPMQNLAEIDRRLNGLEKLIHLD